MSILNKSQLYKFRSSTEYLNKSITDSLKTFSREDKTNKITIFLSHKHDEKKELASVLAFFKQLQVNVYIDWLDKGMPKITSAETAIRIKNKIRENDKFIFLATEGAINSKWCNWELGFGDSIRYINSIALFPIRNDGELFTGSEYLNIYPRIEYVSPYSIERKIGGYFEEGYYVISLPDEDGASYYWKIEEWIKRK